MRRVLLLGLGGLGVEVAKNVVLAGVHSVALLDERPCEARDASANFAIDEAAAPCEFLLGETAASFTSGESP